MRKFRPHVPRVLALSVGVLCALLVLKGCSGDEGSKDNASLPTAATKSVALAQSLPFHILEQEQLKKGGSFKPLRPPRYALLRVRAALTDARPKLTKLGVEATLRALLQTVRDDAQRRGDQIDGITAFLYLSPDHLKGDNVPLGRVEWWPKGHSFAPDNAANIENKATHVETLEVFSFSLPGQVSSVVSRLPEATRREIFTVLVRSEDRAMREAEAKYPTDGSKIPIDKLRTYDWDRAFTKNADEDERLRKKYKRELIQKYRISESELEAIKKEALKQQWPFPPLR
jgi:hypothetical protein